MSQKIKVLFPIDFEDASLKAYPTVEYLAKIYDAEIFLIHVLEPPAAAARLFSSFDEAEERKHANAQLDKFIKDKGNADIIYNKIIKVGGKPWKAIIEAATELTANVIIMGTHGASGLGEIFAGTNAARVISTAPCPVITLQLQQTKPGFSKILLPIDLTRETGEKLELGVEFAKNFSADLVVVSILQSKNERDKERLQNRMVKAVQHIKKQGVNVESTMLVSKGDISKVVLDFADECNADLIMIMTQQEKSGGLKSTFFGTDSVHVVNHSKIPVLSIKPKREYKSASFSGSHFG
jgi:nucleotide-binding universal stress UspA family protein